MDYNNDSFFKILIGQYWKTLPIFEGKDLNNVVVHTSDKALDNYYKHLTFLVTKINGMMHIWQDNQYFVELYILTYGMQDFNSDNHEQVKYMVNHCITLIKNIQSSGDNNES